MKKSIPVVATLAAIVVGTAATSTALASSASTATAGRSSKLSGALVIAWNQELLKIVQTPGAQPATVHQTRSYAMLHAAIDDAIVSITRDASPLLVSVRAPRGARPDAAAIEAGRATLTALYPGFKGEVAQLADGDGACARRDHAIELVLEQAWLEAQRRRPRVDVVLGEDDGAALAHQTLTGALRRLPRESSSISPR